MGRPQEFDQPTIIRTVVAKATHDAFRAACRAAGKTMSQVMREAIDAMIASQGGG